MELSQQITLPASQAKAWDALNDVVALQACIPGCETLDDKGEGAYELVILAAVGPVKARFKGRMNLRDVQPPEGYSIEFEGQGGVAGFGKGSAEVRLDPLDDTSCTLHYTARATVGGKIAQIGARLVDMAAQKMAAEFFAKFQQVLDGSLLPSAPPQIEAAAEHAGDAPPTEAPEAKPATPEADAASKGWRRFLKRDA